MSTVAPSDTSVPEAGLTLITVSFASVLASS